MESMRPREADMLARPCLADLLCAGTAALEAASVPDAARDAEWLLGAAVGLNRGQLHLAARERVSMEARCSFDAWCARRAKREPLQYILGSQPFLGHTILVDPRVLIPRPETERVVELCFDLHHGGPIADLGTGSGAVAIALAAGRPHEPVFATDISRPALAVASKNARHAGVSNVSFACGDLFAALGDHARECALVVCNAPYVATPELETLAPEVRDWEPRLALDGGPDGFDFFRRLAPTAAAAMRPGAWMVVELGAGQRCTVEALFEETRGFTEAVMVRDHGGIERAVAFRRKPDRAA